MAKRLLFVFLFGLGISNLLPMARSQETQKAIEALRNIQANDRNMSAASQAAKQLSTLKGDETLKVLKAMKGASPIGRNWLSGIAASLHTKTNAPSRDQLLAFLKDSDQDGEARYLVFQWLTSGDEAARKAMLATMLEDNSPEIRYAAVDLSLKNIENAADKKESLQKVLDVARHPEQVTSLIDLLEKEGVVISKADHFGFLKNWKVIGPFDNRDQAAFNTEYPVELDLLKGTPKDSYEGKNGSVVWKDASADDKEGQVDLNPVYDKEKGAITYGYSVFKVKEKTKVQIRLGCINANKVWVNGELILSNEVYHTGAMIDQYIGEAELKAGENRIVVKVCQNEQTEPWAQNWAFQLRICDSTGKATVQSKE